ncbi:MAG: L-threonylcarbamoyladenylate synthase [Pseudomonadota bacterium]
MSKPNLIRAADPSAIQEAAKILKGGGLVGLPTETVYGLAANAADDKAVARLYAAKGRPSFNPLISHVFSAAAAWEIAAPTPLARKLADAFWPGPLTLVLARRVDAQISDLACAGLDTIAIRVPSHPTAQTLLTEFGGPIVAPSANPSGQLSPTTAAHVASGLGDKIDLILDGGPCEAGLESTVVDAQGDGPVLLRPGALPRGDMEAIVGSLKTPVSSAGDTPTSPGMLLKHYAPDAALRINAETPRAGEAFLAFGSTTIETPYNLSPAGDLVEAAANLFAMLRDLDARYNQIAVARIPSEGLGEAINDRLTRAAER